LAHGLSQALGKTLKKTFISGENHAPEQRSLNGVGMPDDFVTN
jgi:hypothetical protein